MIGQDLIAHESSRKVQYLKTKTNNLSFLKQSTRTVRTVRRTCTRITRDRCPTVLLGPVRDSQRQFL